MGDGSETTNRVPTGRAACTSIHRAAGRGWTETVARLLDEGADINARDEVGRTAVSLAAKNSRAETVRLLIERGADVNIPCQRGWTPIRHCHRAEAPEVVVMLIEAGATLDDRGRKWWLAKARDKGYGELEAVLTPSA